MSFYCIIECFETAESVYGAWEIQKGLHVGMYEFMWLSKPVLEESYRMLVTCTGSEITLAALPCNCDWRYVSFCTALSDELQCTAAL